ncbi:MAG: MerR family transcriptional regulator [Treponema sp.]|nr:MerR family transcriptional regulator [Treponema sp.]
MHSNRELSIKNLSDIFNVISSSAGVSYTSADVMKKTGVSRQVLRMVIDNGLISPSTSTHQSKQYYAFSNKDLIALNIINSLLNIGIKLVDKRKNHPETITDIFKKYDCDLSSIINHVEGMLINNISSSLGNLVLFHSIANYKKEILANPFFIKSIIMGASESANLYPAKRISTIDDYILSNVAALAEVVNSESPSNDQFIDALKDYCVAENSNISEIIEAENDTDLENLFILANSEIGVQKLKKNFSEDTVSAFRQIINNEFFSAYDVEYDNLIEKSTAFINSIPQNISPKKISEYSSELRNYINHNNLESHQIEKKEIIDKYYLWETISLSLLDEKGNLAKKIDAKYGKQTAKKIIANSEKCLNAIITPYINEFNNLIQEVDNSSDIEKSIQKILNFFSDLVSDMLTAVDINFEALKKLIFNIMEMAKEEISKDSSLSKDDLEELYEYIDFSVKRMMKKIKKKQKEAESN